MVNGKSDPFDQEQFGRMNRQIKTNPKSISSLETQTGSDWAETPKMVAFIPTECLQ
jgi:hypothetical protein